MTRNLFAKHTTKEKINNKKGSASRVKENIPLPQSLYTGSEFNEQ